MDNVYSLNLRHNLKIKFKNPLSKKKKKIKTNKIIPENVSNPGKEIETQ